MPFPGGEQQLLQQNLGPTILLWQISEKIHSATMSYFNKKWGEKNLQYNKPEQTK